jgi:hypothetical protein
MMTDTPILEATQTGESTFKVDVRPDAGIPVTLFVMPVLESRGHRYYVKRTPDPNSMGYISRHTTFEAAAGSATRRAKRYLASYARTARRRAVAA